MRPPSTVRPCAPTAASDTHRLAGEVPHTSIDTEAAWSKSGYHGWWYGWKLHLAVVVGSLWIPLAAEFTISPVTPTM